LLLAGLLGFALDAGAWERGAVQRFATLPPGALNPEGITVEPNSGDVYATGFNPTGAGAGQIYVFGENGQYKRTLTVSNSSSALLGLDFHPDTHALLVLDIGAGNMLDVDPHTGAGTVVTSIGPGAGLNALTFDHNGNVYILHLRLILGRDLQNRAERRARDDLDAGCAAHDVGLPTVRRERPAVQPHRKRALCREHRQ
jgi:hypothetical protein